MDIGNGFTMVKFDLEDDCHIVMDGGHWMIFFIITQPCNVGHQSLLPPTAKIDQTMIWIHFPVLNVFYYNNV